MTTKKIYLKKYFDTFIISDATIKQGIKHSVAVYDDIKPIEEVINGVEEAIQQRVNEIKQDFLHNVLSDFPPQVFQFFQHSFRVDISASRNIERLENIYQIRAYLLVDEKFYDKYHEYLSKYLNM